MQTDEVTMREAISVVAVGDVIVNRAEPESIFKYTRDIIQKVDLSVCQLETSYSDQGSIRSSGPKAPWRMISGTTAPY
jgi:hypothetical protein